MSDIREAFHKLILDQTIVHGKLLAIRVPDYDDLMRDINRLFAELKNMLPDEGEEMWFEYEEKMNHLHSLAEAFLYEQGLKDGFVLSQMLLER
ncbi:hypothetical protein FE784_25645 [Paenibacillus hemerocallicola]|uniref:Uncharacterized protein n=1 Tax=Paenibacillus hemerocallicola TaxID=1172614 RepID=A0A5C4T5E7_9BACL|nr:hypothetical protein [Paenibacillus hemerocallicola]TNJ63429.1 hypothetical protein FE784_25645 [Paenibacillus hemerocallicola]